MSFLKSIFKNYPYLTLFSLFLFLFFLIFNVFSWTIPQDNPPNSNLPAPLNVSSQEQTKEGNLNINGLLRLGRFTSHPTGTNGALYYNTTDNKFYGYSNNSWQELGGGFWTLSNDNIYNTNTGNVGIGTTSPTEKLEVSGNIKLSGATPTYRITNVASPLNDSDVATKGYVDAGSVAYIVTTRIKGGYNNTYPYVPAACENNYPTPYCPEGWNVVDSWTYYYPFMNTNAPSTGTFHWYCVRQTLCKKQ